MESQVALIVAFDSYVFVSGVHLLPVHNRPVNHSIPVIDFWTTVESAVSSMIVSLSEPDRDHLKTGEHLMCFDLIC